MNYSGVINEYLFSSQYLILGLFAFFGLALNQKRLLSINSKGSWLIFILILAYFEGVLDFINFPSSGINRLAREVLIVCLGLVDKNARRGVLSLMLVHVFFVLIVLLFGDTSFYQVSSYSRKLFWPFYFILVFHTEILKNSKVWFRLVHYFLRLQMFVYFLKFILFGVTEYYVGTMSLLGGSATTMMVLVGTLMELAKSQSKPKRIIWIFLWLLVGVVGAKRGVAFYVPILLIIEFWRNGLAKYEIRAKQIVFLLLGPVTLFVLVAIMLSIVPNLNPSNRVFGKIDFGYAYDYIIEYNSYTETSGTSDSRLFAYTELLDDKGLKWFRGYGSGSFFKDITDKAEGQGEVFLFNKFGIGYGVRLGFLWISLQSGVLFGLTYFFIYLRFLKRLSPYFPVPLIGIFIFDFFTYSSTLLTSSFVAYVFLLLIFLLNPESFEKSSFNSSTSS